MPMVIGEIGKGVESVSLLPISIEEIDEVEQDNILIPSPVLIPVKVIVDEPIPDFKREMMDVGDIGDVVIPPDNVFIPITVTKTKSQATAYYYVKDGREIFVVLDDQYDVTDLSVEEIQTLKVARLVYIAQFKDKMDFDVFIYNLYTISVFKRALAPLKDPTYKALKIDTKDPILKTKVFITDIKTKFSQFKAKYTWLVPVGIVVGVIVVGLVGYQFTKSYVSEKGRRRASK